MDVCFELHLHHPFVFARNHFFTRVSAGTTHPKLNFWRQNWVLQRKQPKLPARYLMAGERRAFLLVLPIRLTGCVVGVPAPRRGVVCYSSRCHKGVGVCLGVCVCVCVFVCVCVCVFSYVYVWFVHFCVLVHLTSIPQGPCCTRLFVVVCERQQTQVRAVS
jgi:hypothetical protein